VDVKMIHKVLSPCVQDTEKTYLDPQMFGVSGEFDKSFTNGAKQDVVKDSLIPQGKRIEFRRDGKDHMEVLDWKEGFFPLLEPFFFLEKLTFWAMPVSTRVVRYPDAATGITLIHMTSQL